MKPEFAYINPRNGKRYHRGMLSEDPRTGRTTIWMTQLFGNANVKICFESEVLNRWQKAQVTPDDLAFYHEHIAAR